MARFVAVVTDDAFPDVVIEKSILDPIGCIVVPANGSDESTENADALLVSRAAIGRNVIEQSPRLKVIGRYGVGVENVDLQAAGEHGVTVLAVGDYCVEEVAEHVLGLVFSCSRQAVRLDRIVRSGRWSPADMRATRLVKESTLGLLGLGKIGVRVAERAAGAGLKVVAYDPFIEKVPSGTTLVGLDRLLRDSDFISLHAPLTETTRQIIGDGALAAMKPSAFLINTARGGLVDEKALERALREGEIAGAALDVLSVEPPLPDHPLLAFDNVIFTPHVGFYSDASLARRKRAIAEGVRDVLQGRPPGPDVKVVTK